MSGDWGALGYFVEYGDQDVGDSKEATVPAGFAAATGEIKLYEVTYSVSGATGGTLTTTVDGVEIASGSQVVKGKPVVFTATPAEGYQVKEWKVDGTVLTGITTNTYTVDSLDKAVNVTVSFELRKYTVTFKNYDGRVLTTVTVEHGKSATAPDAPTRDGCYFTGTEKTATATTTREDGRTITSVVLDDEGMEERLKREGSNALVTIPVTSDADVVISTLNGQTVKAMENKDAVLEIRTENVTYSLPASQINIDAVSEQFGEDVELNDIVVNVRISEPAEDTVRFVEDAADKNNYLVVVKPVEFEITCSSGDRTVEVSRFSAYVERMIEIPQGVDPSKITTGIILHPDGTFTHVPTVVTIIDGKYYAKINSLTNSIYSVIYNPEAFRDVETQWAKEAVNDMASRLVMDSVDDEKFEPECLDVNHGDGSSG